MVAKKKVAIVVGRYYLTLPLVIGFYKLFNWKISVIDVGQDATGVSKDVFFKSLPASIKTYQFRKEDRLVKHLAKEDYDIVFATTVKHKSINKARTLGVVRNFYIIFGAFLKPPLSQTGSVTGNASDVAKRPNYTEQLRKIFNWRSYYIFLDRQIGKIKKRGTGSLDNPDAYDIVFCWNKAESHYYESDKQVITAHPYHVYLAREARTTIFTGKILIAHTGDPEYYTPGYNELIEAIIEKYSATCHVFIKAHPLGKNFPEFRGKYSVIYKTLDEMEAAQYDIFINEDSYMGVEMFFRGKYVINYGVIDHAASNIDFTHMWSDDHTCILDEMDAVIANWETVNSKHIEYLRAFYAGYVPPESFGPMALHASQKI